MMMSENFFHDPTVAQSAQSQRSGFGSSESFHFCVAGLLQSSIGVTGMSTAAALQRLALLSDDDEALVQRSMHPHVHGPKSTRSPWRRSSLRAKSRTESCT